MDFVTLSNGVKMPQLGYGVYQVSTEECEKSVEVSMEKLKTDYIDLLLLHQPFGDSYGAWRALEELSEDDMQKIAALDKNKSSFFSHQDPAMVEWFVKLVEERKSHK